MKYLKAIAAPLTCALMAACLILPLGCEDDPSTTDVDAWFDAHPLVSDPRSGPYELQIAIEPESASISYIGQQVTFYAQGGPSDYRWEVANDNGTIAPSAQSDTATYTADQIAPNTVIVYDSRGHAGLANITAGSAGTLDIVPSSITVTVPAITDTNGVIVGHNFGAINGNILEFNVIGGTRPYTEWNNSSPDIGTISPATPGGATIITYTLTGNPISGDDTIIVVDSAGQTDTATVSVELEGE